MSGCVGLQLSDNVRVCNYGTMGGVCGSAVEGQWAIYVVVQLT